MAAAAPARTQVPGPTSKDLERQAQQRRAWDAYRGEMKQFFTPEGNEPDFNVESNRCGPVVNTGMYLLYGAPVGIELGEDAPEGAADYLKKAWGDEDDFMVFCQEMEISSAVNGSSVVQIIPPGDPSNDTLYAQMLLVDASTVSVRTAPGNCKKVLMYIIDQQEPAPNGGIQYYRQVYERLPKPQKAGDPTWRISYYVAKNASSASYEPDPARPALDWHYPYDPLQGAPNLPNPHEWWGLPDLTKSIIGMNESSNFVEGNTKKIIYNQAHDVVAIKGVNNPNQKPIKIEPGHILPLGVGQDITSVQAHGDIANSRLFAADLRGNMDEDSGVNAVVMGRMSELPRGAISGVAIKMLFMPSLMKTISKRRLQGKLLRQLCRIHLYHGDFDPNADTIQVNLAWQDPVPVDDLAQWQSAPIEEQMGMSKHTILANRGESYEEELKLRQAEAQDEQNSFNAGTGPNPLANQFANQPLPPEMQQTMQNASQDMSMPEAETGAGAV